MAENRTISNESSHFYLSSSSTNFYLDKKKMFGMLRPRTRSSYLHASIRDGRTNQDIWHLICQIWWWPFILLMHDVDYTLWFQLIIWTRILTKWSTSYYSYAQTKLWTFFSTDTKNEMTSLVNVVVMFLCSTSMLKRFGIEHNFWTNNLLSFRLWFSSIILL